MPPGRTITPRSTGSIKTALDPALRPLRHLDRMKKSLTLSPELLGNLKMGNDPLPEGLTFSVSPLPNIESSVVSTFVDPISGITPIDPLPFPATRQLFRESASEIVGQLQDSLLSLAPLAKPASIVIAGLTLLVLNESAPLENTETPGLLSFGAFFGGVSETGNTSPSVSVVATPAIARLKGWHVGTPQIIDDRITISQPTRINEVDFQLVLRHGGFAGERDELGRLQRVIPVTRETTGNVEHFDLLEIVPPFRIPLLAGNTYYALVPRDRNWVAGKYTIEPSSILTTTTSSGGRQLIIRNMFTAEDFRERGASLLLLSPAWQLGDYDTALGLNIRPTNRGLHTALREHVRDHLSPNKAHPQVVAQIFSSITGIPIDALSITIPNLSRVENAISRGDDPIFNLRIERAPSMIGEQSFIPRGDIEWTTPLSYSVPSSNIEPLLTYVRGQPVFRDAFPEGSYVSRIFSTSSQTGETKTDYAIIEVTYFEVFRKYFLVSKEGLRLHHLQEINFDSFVATNIDEDNGVLTLEDSESAPGLIGSGAHLNLIRTIVRLHQPQRVVLQRIRQSNSLHTKLKDHVEGNRRPNKVPIQELIDKWSLITGLPEDAVGTKITNLRSVRRAMREGKQPIFDVTITLNP